MSLASFVRLSPVLCSDNQKRNQTVCLFDTFRGTWNGSGLVLEYFWIDSGLILDWFWTGSGVFLDCSGVVLD